MSFPTKWLIATNGSKYASEAVRYAGQLSAQFAKKPEVIILVVANEKENEDTAKGIMEMANFLFEESSDGLVTPTLLVKVGEPGKTIVDTANELKCGQILIGGADFKWDINSKEPGGVSNYIIDKFAGVISVIK